jgi:hypothetical protein
MPFTGRNAVDVLMQKGAREAQRVTGLRPEIPDALAEVIARCLRRAPDERPPSMRSLEYELTRAVDGRATAVAAVLGIGEGEGRVPDDPRPDASASMHRAAIAAIQNDAGVYGPAYSQQEMTQVAPVPRLSERAQPALRAVGPDGARPIDGGAVLTLPAPALQPTGSLRPVSGPMPVVRRPQATGFAAAKAAAFTLLGGLLAVGMLAVLAPGGLAGMFGDKSTPADPGQTQAPAAEPPAKTAPAPKKQAEPDAPRPSKQPPAKAPAPEAEPTVVEDEAEEVIEVAPPSIESMNADELVALGDELAGSKAWLEPSDRNLALVVSKLAIVDPGNEAVRKLRQAAADDLLPAAQAALEKRRWADAAAAFRALHQIWPTHPEAREGLIEALEGEAKILSSRKYKDYEGALAAINELLVMLPHDPDVLEAQGDMLDQLERYAEARDAYKLARKEKPRSRELFKKYLRAIRKARKANAG